jgi:pantoate--beta-alanine ligase
MRTVRTIGELRGALDAERTQGRSVALVPTMGALHEGHLALIRRARGECGVVVVSLFVNPTQFGAGEDLERYPRDERSDAALAAGAGADLLFAPAVGEVYPDGFATVVSVGGVSEVLEGARRGRAHFDGVCTVVLKLLNIAGPDVAFFGQKDAQQVAVVRRLVRDLDVRTRLEVCPTVREPDGVAMSSRNAYLSPADRARAVALVQGLRAARELLEGGERSAEALVAAATAAMSEHGVEPEYVALVDPDSFRSLDRVAGPSLLAVAARVGATRLIDNEVLVPEPLLAHVSHPIPEPRKEQPCSA